MEVLTHVLNMLLFALPERTLGRTVLFFPLNQAGLVLGLLHKYWAEKEAEMKLTGPEPEDLRFVPDLSFFSEPANVIKI